MGFWDVMAALPAHRELVFLLFQTGPAATGTLGPKVTEALFSAPCCPVHPIDCSVRVVLAPENDTYGAIDG
jgi:hypothetical protein